LKKKQFSNESIKLFEQRLEDEGGQTFFANNSSFWCQRLLKRDCLDPTKHVTRFSQPDIEMLSPIESCQ